MALKNLFDMVKADRYTADGREALIKAQEAEIEDRVYQIGEISQKTGLQKTAQGWKPPKETKFGKVQQKNGEWGVQTKTGKGSSFIKHKDEADAKRALANYTAGYNRAGRNKEDPHSDKARQIKHWNKETDQIAKKYREERRAAHAEAAKKGNAERQDKIEKLRERAFNKTQLEGLSKGKLDNLYKSEMESKPAESKPAENHPPKVMPKGMSPAEFMKAWEDDARKHGFEKGQGYEWREYLRKEEEEGEASAKAFADRVHKGEIKYNEETGKLEESKPGAKKQEEPKNVHRAEVDKASQRMRDAEKEIDIAESLERMYSSRGMENEAAAAREYRNAAETFKALNGQVANLPRNQMPDAELQQKVEAAKTKLNEARVKARPGMAGSKPAAERKPDGVDEEGNIKIPKAGMNVLVKVNGNRPGKIVSSRGDYVEVEMPARGAYPGRRDTYYKSDLKFDEEMKADALERSDAERATDAAPRQLTGDTRIRVRKA